MEQKNTILKEEKLEEQVEKIDTEKEVNNKKLTKKEHVFVLFIIFLSAFMVLSIYWLHQNTGNVTLEQLIFHLKVPMKGTNTDMVWDYMQWTFIRVFMIVMGIGAIIILFEHFIKIQREKKKKILYMFSKIVLVTSVVIVMLIMNVYGFAKNQITASTLIEEEYIDPLNANITFPEQKQNLIYIFL